ncbi:MAG TPA: DUF58 domain-containing protein [Microbacteriaceae bacterium]|nr:DUF58 domain-containing protein [Microbacteriaceae bacterium]
MTSTIVRTPPELGDVGLTNARTRLVGSRDGALADAVVAAVRTGRSAGTVCAAVWARVRSIVTPLGFAAFALTASAFIGGYVFGWQEAVVVAWAMLAIAVLAVVWVLGKPSYDVRLSMPSKRVVAGDKAPGGIAVHNRGRTRAIGARIELPVGHGLAEFALPSLGRDRRYDDVFLVPTARRGVIPIGPARMVRSDPVGLLRREISWEGSLELLVHPRTIAIPSMSTGFVRDLEGNPTRDLTASDISFHALREYAPGDEPRTIHWKSTAKTGDYMVRQFEQTRRSHLMVALTLAESDYASDDEFELAVSVAGSLGVRAIRDGRTVSVVAGERTPDFAKRAVLAVTRLSTITPSRLLDDLARVEPATAQLRIVELCRVASDGAVGVSVAFLVCGSSATPAQLRRAATQFPVGVEVVAVVCDPGTAPSLRQVGELSVLTVGFLDDLQKSLARSRAT